MNTILAIETSVPSASVAILQKGEITQHDFESHRQQNQLLFTPLEAILTTLEGLTIDTILIGTGPGSYSGSRIAIAAAQGLATVYQSKLAGVCSFFAVPDRDLASSVALGDARRGSYFHYDTALSQHPVKPVLQDAEDFVTTMATYSDKSLFTFETKNELPLENVSIVRPTASALIHYWATLSPEQQEALMALPLEPLYLRAPFITKSTKNHPLLKK